MSTYRIHWHDPATGRRGVGTKEFPQAEAEQLAIELNSEYPHLAHEARPTCWVAILEPEQIPPDAVFAVTDLKQPHSEQVLTDTDPFPNWGKFAGTPMKDVPSGYLDWLLSQPQLLRAWPAIADYIHRSRKAIAQDLDRSERST